MSLVNCESCGNPFCTDCTKRAGSEPRPDAELAGVYAELTRCRGDLSDLRRELRAGAGELRKYARESRWNLDFRVGGLLDTLAKNLDRLVEGR